MPFPTTRWTILAEATLHGDASGRVALENLCVQYQRPVEQFIASRGYGPSDRQDLVQEFFLNWLRVRAWKRADRARGRFRNFMLGAVNHLLLHEEAKKTAQKRGGGIAVASLDDEAFTEEVPEPDAEAASAFDRDWAVALVTNVLKILRAEFEARQKGAEFSVLQSFLPGSSTVLSLEEAALRLDTNVNAFKASLHRLRERFRDLLRLEVARTVSAPHEVDEELQYLRELLMKLPPDRIPSA